MLRAGHLCTHTRHQKSTGNHPLFARPPEGVPFWPRKDLEWGPLARGAMPVGKLRVASQLGGQPPAGRVARPSARRFVQNVGFPSSLTQRVPGLVGGCRPPAWPFLSRCAPRRQQRTEKSTEIP